MEIKTASENYTYEIVANNVATAGANANIDSQGMASINFNVRNTTAFFGDKSSREAMHTLLDTIIDKAEANFNALPTE